MYPGRERAELVRRLLHAACVSAEWESDRSMTARDRLAWALSLHRLELRVEGLQLFATLSEDLTLALTVRLTSPCTDAMELALRRVLGRSPTLIAELVRVDWPEVWQACRLASPATAHGAP
jgi:hypothetical protein